MKTHLSLRPYNTFGIEAYSKYGLVVSGEQHLRELIADQYNSPLPWLILGGGSNVLFTQNFEGITILNRIIGKEIVKEDDQQLWLRVGAGEVWQDLVQYCLANDWGGIENLSLIPGSVGAAPIQNIGAYGVELQEVFVSLEAIHLETGNLHHFHREDCRFGYRDSIFKQEAKAQYCITQVTLCLQKAPHSLNTSYGAIREELNKRGEEASIQLISAVVSEIRRSKLPDPARIGNAGSFFKNPVISRENLGFLQAEYPDIPHYPQPDQSAKIPAAWLIQTAGWKGVRKGSYGVHDRQALVLVNYGGARGKDIYALSQEIKESVHQQFNIELEREVQIL